MVEGAVGVPGGGDSPPVSSSPSGDRGSRVSSFGSAFLRICYSEINI